MGIDWNRRRFLAVTGAMSVVAGCAAEPVEEADDGTNSVNESEGTETESATEDDGKGTDDEDEGDGEEDSEEGDGNGTDDLEDGTDEDAENESADETGADGNETGGDAGEGTDDTDGSEEEGDDTDHDGGNDDGEDDGSEGNGESEESKEDKDEPDDDGDDASGGNEGDDGDEPDEPPLSDISIRVVDPGGEPIVGATVHGEGEAHDAEIPLEFDGETGDSGAHHNTIYENAYTIEVHHPDYESATVEHVHDGDTDVEVELKPAAEEPPVSEITVRVVDSDGNPIEGAEIFGVGDPHPAEIPLEFDGETDGEGVHATPIYENVYTIEVDHPDYASATVEHVHDGDTDVEAVLESRTHRLTVVAVDGNGTPVEDAFVEVGERIDTTGTTGRTDENGAVAFDVEEGEYSVAAMKGVTHTPVLVEEYLGTVTVEGETTHEQEVAHVRNCAVTIRVSDPDGESIEDAVVDIDIQPEEIWEYDTRNAQTDANGEIEVEAWCGQWTFQIGAEGYDWVEDGRDVEDGSEEEFVLDPDERR